jgi:hypothetical protein
VAIVKAVDREANLENAASERIQAESAFGIRYHTAPINVAWSQGGSRVAVIVCKVQGDFFVGQGGGAVLGQNLPSDAALASDLTKTGLAAGKGSQV